MKLRKKITSTVQVLTHLKEKLQFVQAESHVQKRKLHAVEQEVAQVSTAGGRHTNMYDGPAWDRPKLHLCRWSLQRSANQQSANDAI